MITETSIIRVGQQGIVDYLFYAEDLDGNFQAAHSEAFFGDPNDIETSQADAALNDLTARLQAQGWHQVVGTPPNPWYSLTFQRQVLGQPTIKTSTVQSSPQGIVNYLFYTENQDGSKIAQSGAFFGDPNDIETAQADAALNDLTTRMSALGWQQVVGTSPNPWYSLTFQQVVYPSTTTSIVKPRQQDAIHNLFYAETEDGNHEVAHSDQTFFGDPDIETTEAKAALNDLVAKLQAQGWQQITKGIPNPWYSLEFKGVIS